MNLLEIIREARKHLEENGRVSLRVLRRQFELDDDALAEVIEELVDVQRVARREENVLVGVEGAAASQRTAAPAASSNAGIACAVTRPNVSRYSLAVCSSDHPRSSKSRNASLIARNHNREEVDSG